MSNSATWGSILSWGIFLSLLGAGGIGGSFALLSRIALSSNDYKFIGDSLQNSSGVISISSNISSIEMIFDKKVEAVYNSSVKPPTLIEYLPETEVIKNGHNEHGINLDYNYLGEREPIYLLNGSKITYYLKVESTNHANGGVACIYLFNDKGWYLLYFALPVYFSRYVQSECFFTSENTRVMPWSFNITEESQYYVALYISKGVTVTSNVSVDRVYYNSSAIELTELICNDTNSCSLQRCSSCDESYIIIQTNNSTNVSYTLYEYTTVLTNSSQINFALVMFFSCVSLTVGVGMWCMGCLVVYGENCCDDNSDSQVSRSSVIQNKNTIAKTKSSKDKNGKSAYKTTDTRSLLTDLSLSSESTATIPSLTESIAMIPQSSKKGKSSSQKGDQKLPTSTSSVQLTHYNLKVPLHTQKEERADIELNPCPPSTMTRSSLSEVTTTRSLEETSFTQTSNKATKKASSTVYASKPRGKQKSIESKPRPPCEELAKAVFGSLTQTLVDSRGLTYHSSQYGVTLIIPKGAVQGSAIVWFGACLFSDKFDFGDYVPVTPIVWVHIDRKLEKQAKLYIPHDMYISSEADQDKFTLLTANNGDNTFHQQTETGPQLKMDKGFKLFKINSLSFCTTCAAIHKDYDKSFAKQYLIAITEKHEAKKVLIDFIFLSRQQSWKKIIAAQCEKEGFEIMTYKPITFTSHDPVSLTFEPDDIPGWTRECDIPTITASSIYDKFRKIDPQRDEFSFHNFPRFKIQFTHNETLSEHPQSKEVTITFNEVNPSVVNTVLLKSHLLSSTATGDTELHSTANDPLLGDCLQIIVMEGNLQEKWFNLGCRLDLTFDELHEIETICSNSIQCTRRAITEWKRKSKSTSMRPLSAALKNIGLSHLADRIDHLHQFPDCISPISLSNPAAAHFQSHFADIQASIAARLQQALPKFFEAKFINQKLHDDVIGMPGKSDDEKSAMITGELLRGIQNSSRPNRRLGRMCKIFLELEDEKLKEFAESVARRNFFAETARHPVSHPEEYSKQNFGITDELSINDLAKVLSVLTEAIFGPVHWNDLGLSLGLFMTTLDVIGRTNGDANDYLKLTLQKWLEKRDNVTGTKWDNLIRAVKSTGDNAAAERIPWILRSHPDVNY